MIRVPGAGIALLLVLLSAACDAGGSGEDPSTREAVPGELLYEAPASEEVVLIENASRLAVRDTFVFVTDRTAHRVHVFSTEGRFLRSIGSSGEGPGEIEAIGDIQFISPDSLFIGDTGDGNVEVFTTDGEHVGTRNLRESLFRFARTERGFVGASSGAGSVLSAYTDSAVVPLDITLDGFDPPSMPFRQVARLMLVGVGGNQLFVVDTNAGDAWSVELAGEPSATRLSYSGELRERFHREREQIRESLQSSTMVVPMIRNVHAAGNTAVWLDVPWSGTIGVLVPASSERNDLVVYNTERQEQRPPVDSHLVGNRLYLLYSTTFEVYRLEMNAGR